MTLEVGMYVRTNLGIAKITEYKENKNFDNEFLLDKEIIDTHEDYYSRCLYDYEFYLDQVIKASHNIIDLIEEKDLLEIEYFSLRYEKRVTRLFEVTFKDGRFTNLDNSKCQFMLINNDWSDSDKELEPIIKSIVTKEQFESMAYRIGE